MVIFEENKLIEETLNILWHLKKYLFCIRINPCIGMF